MQIPEIWQFDGKRLTLLALKDEVYVPIERSLAFPKAEGRAIASFLQQAIEKDYLELVSEFRQWLKSL